MPKYRRRYQRVLDEISMLIDSGEYPAGGRLPPERELAERFAVSRPTIREAVIALEALNRVQVKTGSGVYVLASFRNGNGIDSSVTALELTEARALIEGEAAALAATMITKTELSELEGALYEMAAESVNDRLVSELADKKFHHLIAKATRNEVMISVVENLWYVRNNSTKVHQAYQAICETDGKVRVQEHEDIFDALKKRNVSMSRSAMHEHFSRILNKLIATSEAEEVEKIRQSTAERRARFSLNHLVSKP